MSEIICTCRQSGRTYKTPSGHNKNCPKHVEAVRKFYLEDKPFSNRVESPKPTELIDRQTEDTVTVAILNAINLMPRVFKRAGFRYVLNPLNVIEVETNDGQRFEIRIWEVGK